MRGRIGPRGGTCGVKIYRGLPEVGCLLITWSSKLQELYTRYELELIWTAILKSVGAEWSRGRRGEQNRALPSLSAILQVDMSGLHSTIPLCID